MKQPTSSPGINLGSELNSILALMIKTTADGHGCAPATFILTVNNSAGEEVVVELSVSAKLKDAE
jgi:hypothetical protein